MNSPLLWKLDDWCPPEILKHGGCTKVVQIDVTEREAFLLGIPFEHESLTIVFTVVRCFRHGNVHEAAYLGKLLMPERPELRRVWRWLQRAAIEMDN